MKKALITGGCGFLGSFIVRAALKAGAEVRVLAKPGEKRTALDGLDVDIREGDIRIRADVESAVGGVDTVFHAAAVYDDFAPDPTLMHDVNLRGTFHVLRAAREAGVDKVVYTASIASLGRPVAGQSGDEETPFDCWDIDFPYARSKFFSRELAEYFADWGQDVRVVCPGVVLGPGDLRPTPSGQIILTAMLPGPAMYFDGGAGYVDVRDAAEVHVLAALRGKPGERYVASAHNYTNRELVELIAQVSGHRRPMIYLPRSVAWSMFTAMDIIARRTGTRPLVSKVFYQYALRAPFFRSDKARRELGASFRPLSETVQAAIEDFEARGLIRRGKPTPKAALAERKAQGDRLQAAPR